MGGVGSVAAEHPTRHDRIDRWPRGLHDPDLDRRGVGPQQGAHRLPVVHVKGVVHVPGWVSEREVQRSEIVPLVFDLGPLDHRVAHAHEQVLKVLPGPGDHVPVAEPSTPVQLGQVQALRLQPMEVFVGLQFGPTSIQETFQLGPDLVKPPSGIPSLVGL